MLYHFTDTARLPWIIQSGVLLPGRNKIGGFPDPDFLWATTSEHGDRTASAHAGDQFRQGNVRLVRITLESKGFFFPWREAPGRFPQWTPEQVARLEAAAAGQSHPKDWWCRSAPLALCEALGIESRSYTDKKWRELTSHEVRNSVDEGGRRWLAMKIGSTVFASHQFENANGALGYELRRA